MPLMPQLPLGRSVPSVGTSRAEKNRLNPFLETGKASGALGKVVAQGKQAEIHLLKENTLAFAGVALDQVPAYEPKGCQFDSQSGHMLPGLRARSPVGGT